MAHISGTDKLPTEAAQFYFQSGGCVLLRIVRDGELFSVLTATAGESKPFVPRRPRPAKPLFLKPDGTPLEMRRSPEPPALHPRAYPDAPRLIESARSCLRSLGAVEDRADQWGRPYIAVHGIADAGAIRRTGNRLAEALGLEADHRPWVAEEMQSLYEDLAIDDSGDDVYLSDGAFLSKGGRLR